MGNFSKNPDAVLQDALEKGYNQVLFQQGKPVLDRELNLLADLASPQRLIEHHIGNGVPDGNDGFRITGLNVAQNDFTIKAGRCLVGGYEITLSADATYKTQPHTENVKILPAGVSYVYLRVFTSEVNHTADGNLNNPGGVGDPDVGFETAVRRKVEWEARVEAGAQTGSNYFLLAIIDKGTATVTDRRRIGLTAATMRDEITTARGSKASLDARLDASLNEDGTLANGATVTGDLTVNGKLGIGAAAPQNKLDVEGGAVIGAAYSGTNIAPTNGLLVEGKVGIGAASPLDTLDINGALRIRGGEIKDSSGTLRISLPASGSLDLKDAGGTSRITVVDNGNLELKEDGGTSALIIDTAGKVGILTTPSDSFDVNGDVRVRGGNIKDAGGTSRITIVDDGVLQLKEDNGTAALTINTDGRAGINATTKLSQFTIKGSYGWKNGTVAYAAGSVNVVGTGTAFLSMVGVGDLFHGSDQAASTRYVVAVTDDTHLTVNAAFTTTQNNSTWFVRAGLFRVDDLEGTPKFFISNWGKVGIGTTLPEDILDVRGTIRLHTDGSLYAPGGVENMRVIRGTVTAGGAAAGGTGFTVQRMATGIYHVTFSQAFAQVPTVVATQHYPDSNDFNSDGGDTRDNCVIVAVSTTRFRIKCGDGVGNASNRRFEFIAMGPR